MQVRGLPRHITRNAAVLSRLETTTADDATVAFRRGAVARWLAARAGGLTVKQAADAVGVPKSTLYRWADRPHPRSRRPRNVRKPDWPPELLEAIGQIRADQPTWGKVKITQVLKREGHQTSEATVGRILRKLVEGKRIPPVLFHRKRRPSRPKNLENWAQRLPKGLRPEDPGDIVQIDTLTIDAGPGVKPVKQFNAVDPVSKWLCSQAHRRATANNAAGFLEKLLREMPFPVKAIQVDGGSEFMAGFEDACRDRDIKLYVLPPRSPQLNGGVERVNGTVRRDFHGCWELDLADLEGTNRWADAFAHEYNTYRPHQALAGLTPKEYLSKATAREPPMSHM